MAAGQLLKITTVTGTDWTEIITAPSTGALLIVCVAAFAGSNSTVIQLRIKDGSTTAELYRSGGNITWPLTAKEIVLRKGQSLELKLSAQTVDAAVFGQPVNKTLYQRVV